jgi:Primase C terminal 2 (PriCT-2)
MAAIPNDASMDWESWNKRGMACWASTGGHELGLEAFDKFSRKNTAKYNERDTRDKWKAYTESTPIRDYTAGSVFRWASEANPDWRSEYEATLPNRLSLIKHEAANLDADATRAEEVLADASMDVFEYSGTLIRPIAKIVDATKDQKTVVVQLEAITQIYLRSCIRFENFNKQEGWVKCGPPKEIADAIIDNKGYWKFNEIIGVVSTPTMHSDGSLLIQPRP